MVIVKCQNSSNIILFHYRKMLVAKLAHDYLCVCVCVYGCHVCAHLNDENWFSNAPFLLRLHQSRSKITHNTINQNQFSKSIRYSDQFACWMQLHMELTPKSPFVWEKTHKTHDTPFEMKKKIESLVSW